MLSHITFILAFALAASATKQHVSASGTQQILGNWRYEGQFIAGNPRLNWDMAGWKLVMDVVIAAPKNDLSLVNVKFIDPVVLSLNDRVREKAAWSQINKLSWLKAGIVDLVKPFAIRFSKDAIKEIICDNSEVKEVVDLKVAFVRHLEAALLDKVGLHRTKTVMGVCDKKVDIKHGAGPTKVITTTYHHCDNSQAPLIGIIPKVLACVNCELPKLALPLDTFKKDEVVTDGTHIMSILTQNVVALPIYEADSPLYSIYGNVSIIRIAAPVVPVTIKVKGQKVVPIYAPGKHPTKLAAQVVAKPDKIIQEALKMIRGIISESGHPKVDANIYGLHDLLSAYGYLIPKIEAEIASAEERKVFYSFLITQESPLALETLMEAVKQKRIPLPIVPVIMLLSAKVTALTDVQKVCTFIKAIEKESPFCAEVSYLALSIIVRRMAIVDPSAMKLISCCLPAEPRWKLAMAGNIGMNIELEKPITDVIMKIAYVHSKRALVAPIPEKVIIELIKMLMDPKEVVAVRAEVFKVLIGLTTDKVVLSTIAARLNEIEEPVLINYLISYLESVAINRLPVYGLLAKIAQEHLPMLKAKKSLSLNSRHITLSAFNPQANMGVAVMVDYVIPQKLEKNYLTASIEIQPTLLNTLFSLLKVQAIIPTQELKALVDAIVALKIKDWKMAEIKPILVKLLPAIKALAAKSEIKIFNDDMEIITINAASKLVRWIESLLPMLSLAGKIQGCVVPIVVKKTIPSMLGPKVVMSIVNYITIDTAYEVLKKPLTLSVAPKIATGLRFRLQADNGVAMNIGTQIKAELMAGKITTVIEREINGLRVATSWPLQVEPLVSLQVIPTTSNVVGTPRRNWEGQSTPSLWAKAVPVNIVASLDEPAIVLNISGKIARPLNQRWLFALQSPQILQVYLLPTYKLPSDVIVAEWAISRGQCSVSKYCTWKANQVLEKVALCQRLCINAIDTEGTVPTVGSSIAVALTDARSIIVDSRIQIAGLPVGQFVANAVFNIPPIIEPALLFNNQYVSWLKQQAFITLPSMQQTLKETEMTEHIKDVMDSFSLVANREEDYTDMNKDIMNLYPKLYMQDILNIKGLHVIFKKLLLLSEKAIVARSQLYTAPWAEMEVVRDSLLEILLKTKVVNDKADIAVMQDHVILWCVSKYFETLQDYNRANKCEKGKVLLANFRTVVFQAWIAFYKDSKLVIKKLLPIELRPLTTVIFSTDQSLINLINRTTIVSIKNQYVGLQSSLTTINGKLRLLSLADKSKASKTLLVKLVGFELLKTIGDHWNIEDVKDNEIKLLAAKTDLAISFLSVASRRIIESCTILHDKKDLEKYQVNVLVNQLIQLLDFNRWIRATLMDDGDLPLLKEAAESLIDRTGNALQVLKHLPIDLALDPMWRMFIIKVIAVHRVTIQELKNLPKYALYEETKVGTNELEWQLITVMKSWIAIDRPWDSLKRGIMKKPEVSLQSGESVFPWGVRVSATIVWPEFKVLANIHAKKSDSQIMREIKETTMSKSEAMEESMFRQLQGLPRSWFDALLLELNIYRDIISSVSVKGVVPDQIRIPLAIWAETLKTIVLPFEVPLSAKATKAAMAHCKTDICARAVISRDNRKVDIVLKDPIEVIQLLQLPTGV